MAGQSSERRRVAAPGRQTETDTGRTSRPHQTGFRRLATLLAREYSNAPTTLDALVESKGNAIFLVMVENRTRKHGFPERGASLAEPEQGGHSQRAILGNSSWVGTHLADRPRRL